MQNELNRIQKFVDSQKQQRSKLEGKLEACEDDLKKEGFENPKEAMKWLKNAEKKYKIVSKEIKVLFKQFKKKFGNKLKEFKEFEND